MMPYLCNQPIEHNGERFEVDAKIDLDDKHAKPLLMVNAIREVEMDAETGSVDASDGQPKTENVDVPGETSASDAIASDEATETANVDVPDEASASDAIAGDKATETVNNDAPVDPIPSVGKKQPGKKRK